MLVRILRRLTLEETEAQIRDLERNHGVTFDEFEELFLTRRINQESADDYFKWAELVHAYRGYVEGGELDCVIEELHDLSSNELKILTPKRLELLYTLSNSKVKSINDLAQKSRRNVKNVYQDLQMLKKFGFIIFRKKGKRNLIPEALVEEVTLLIR